MHDFSCKKFVSLVAAASLIMTFGGIVSADETEQSDETVAETIDETVDEGEEESEVTSPSEDDVVEFEIEEDVSSDSSYAGLGVAINATNFPDAGFRDYVSSNFDTDSNGSLSPAEISNATSISIPGYFVDEEGNRYEEYDLVSAVSDLSGIQYLTALEYLDCSWNEDLSSLDLSRNVALKYLNCGRTSITTINLSNNTELLSVNIQFTGIRSLDLSNNRKLETVAAQDSSLTFLNISNCSNLLNLYLDWCPIRTVDVRGCPAILDVCRNGLFEFCSDGIHRADNADMYYHYMYYYRTPEGYMDGDRAEIVIPIDATLITDTGNIGYVKMYRLYNPNSGEHFYTSSLDEQFVLIRAGWNYEGIGWMAPTTSNTPVYRLYNQYGGEHHYTTNAAERDMLISAGWNDEGIGWYSDDAQTVPLYRQYNPNAFANNHNYTTSLGENDWLVSLGWHAEGIGWYGIG